MPEIARAVSLIIEHEPNAQYVDRDDIDFNTLSSRTLSLLCEFVFFISNKVDRTVGKKNAEQMNQLSSYSRTITDYSVRNDNTSNIVGLVAAFMQNMNLNNIPAIIGQKSSSDSYSSEMDAVSNRCAQTADAFGIDELVQLFNRNWFNAGVNLHYVNDKMSNLHFGESEVIQINMPTFEGQPKSSLLVSRDIWIQLVCLIVNIVHESDTVVTTLPSSIEQASIAEIYDDCDQATNVLPNKYMGIDCISDTASNSLSEYDVRSSDDDYDADASSEADTTDSWEGSSK